jgi:hypothetical protein
MGKGVPVPSKVTFIKALPETLSLPGFACEKEVSANSEISKVKERRAIVFLLQSEFKRLQPGLQLWLVIIYFFLVATPKNHWLFAN